MIGERGRWDWWDCEATTDAGQYLVASLFPRTAAWTGVACALETATAVMEALMPPAPHLHLFALDAVTEGQCARVLAQWQRDRHPQDVCPWPLPEGARQDLPAWLTNLHPAVGEAMVNFEAAPHGRRLAAGAVTGSSPFGQGPELSANPLARLVAGFVQSVPGHLVAPYLDWDR